MNYQIDLQEVSAQPALAIKGKVTVENAGEAIGRILGDVASYLESMGSHPTGAPYTRTFNFENGSLEFEAGFPVKAGLVGEGKIIATELPKGQVATTIHIGSQETSENAYKAMHGWLAKNGRKAAGAPWEVYLSDPGNTPADKARMQIFFPIQ